MAAAGSYSAAKFLLEVDGNPAGLVISVSGGEAFGEVSETVLVTRVVDKAIARLGYEPITLEIDLPLEKPLYYWLDAFLNRSQQRISGAIAFIDYNKTERRRLEWDEGLITEVTFPALDGASKDPARLTCVIQPTRTRRVIASGRAVSVPKLKKLSAACNFSVTIRGLEAPLAKVARFERLVVRQPVVVDDGVLKPGTLQVPPVIFWVPAAYADPLFVWFDEFVVQGRNTEADERSGSLRFLDSKLKDVFLEISLKNLGVVRVSESRQFGNSDSVHRLRVEAYCEQMQLSAESKSADPVEAGGAVPPPADPATVARLTATVSDIFRQALREAVAQPTDTLPAAPGVHRADVVAARLLATVSPAAADAHGPVVTTDVRRALGLTLGAEWAATTGTLSELERLSKLAVTDWSAIVVPEDDSLVKFLVRHGELDEGEIGPLDLVRDSFTEGLVAGASDIWTKAACHLDGSPPCPTTADLGQTDSRLIMDRLQKVSDVQAQMLAAIQLLR